MDDYTTYPALRFGKGAIFYAGLLLFALVFTQALRSPASALLFWFLILYPILALLFVLLGKPGIQVYMDDEITRAEKMSPVTYEIRIINALPLCYPFLEAVLWLPRADGVRCARQNVRLSLIPFGSYSLRRETVFRYRGTYRIGTQCLYVSDFLQLFTVRCDVDIYNDVLVYPRRLTMERVTKTSATDIPNDNATVVFSTEKAEIGNIREYIPGDTLKSIHWKLSSKLQENLMVKEFNTNTSRNVYVLVDFSAPIPPETFEDPEEIKKREKEQKKAEKAAKRKKRHVRLRKNLRGEAMEQVKTVRRKKRMRRGMSDIGAADASAIDDWIAETAEPGFFAKLKARFARRASKPAEEAENAAAEATEEAEAVPETRAHTISAEDAVSLAIGGKIRADALSDMEEYCADGVVEIALAVIQNELRQGNTVTMVWNDIRVEEGVCTAQLTCPEDLTEVFDRFATTPPCDATRSIRELFSMIREPMNITLRICTSHLDPLSLGEYCMIPSLYGGAGNSCVAEICLFSPEERYEKPSLRREYVEMSRITLAKEGVDLIELTVHDGGTENAAVEEKGNTATEEEVRV